MVNTWWILSCTRYRFIFSVLTAKCVAIVRRFLSGCVREYAYVCTLERKKKKNIYKFRCGVRCRVARLIFERLAYTRLVLKKLSGAVDKTADVIHEIQGPSISDERGQLNIGLTKNTTTLVRHSRSCGALRIIRHIKLYVARLARLCSLHVFSLDVRTNTSLRFFLSEEVSLSLSFSLLRTYVLACCTLARQARRDTQE